MASSHNLVDPTSPQSSYGTSVGTSSPTTPASLETAKSTPDQSDFEKIEVMPEKEDVKKPSTATTSTTATTLSTEQSKSEDCVRFHNFCINTIIFAVGAIILVVRISLYNFGDYLFEAITFCSSLMVCSVICCVVKRGHFAKKWDDFPPEFKRKPRGVYEKTPSPQPERFDNPMEPRGSQKQPLHRLKYKVDVHRGAEVESSLEASSPSQGSRKDSSSSDKRLTSSDDSKTDSERKEARAPVPLDDDVKTKSSSPTARVLNLFKRKNTF